MKTNLAVLGAFVLLGVLLITATLFMIGDRHQAFQRHEELYVELATITGIVPGSKVRANGLDAGQVIRIDLPPRPSSKFRLKLKVDEKLRSIIREDSVVSVESDGLVGDKFLMIHSGSDGSPAATAGYTLPGKEPIELAAVIEKASVTIDQANAMLGDVHGKLDGALDAVTGAIRNTDGLVTQIRSGNGTAGVLLNDRETADQVRQTVSNVRQASANLNQVTVQAQQLVTDVQSRNLPAKLDDTVANAKDATSQIDQLSHQVNASMTNALAPDSNGVGAAENLRATLSNVHVATANLADDTEALKHEFLFRGFFKKRGFYSLNDLTPDAYRNDAYFQSGRNRRFWIGGPEAFTTDATGAEILSYPGKQQIDEMMRTVKDSIIRQPMVIEGYSADRDPAIQITLSNQRILLVERYLVERFHLHETDMGGVPLNATPPQSSGKSTWDGACVVLLPRKK